MTKQFGIEYERKCWTNFEKGEYEYRRGVWWKDTGMRHSSFEEIENLIANWSPYAKQFQRNPRVVWREIGEWTATA